MVTIKDVAREAGVSNMTVSRAFNKDSSMKKETREKVIAAAKKLNYVPNYSAKSLVMNRQFSIGLFFSSITGTSESFLGELVNQVYTLLPKNYLLSVNGVDQFRETGKGIVGRFDGIIIATQSEEDDVFIEDISQLEIPFVVMNRYVAAPEIYNVTSDEGIGISQVVQFLAKNNFKTAGCIRGIEGFYSSEFRYTKFVESCKKLGIDFKEEAVERGQYSIESGYLAMEKILNKKIPLPEVIFCGNDDMAIGAVKACRDQGVAVPEDLSIIGFDDTNFSSYVTPSLTTVHKPYKEMAKQSMQILLELIDGADLSQKKYTFNSQMILRDSVKKFKED